MDTYEKKDWRTCKNCVHKSVCKDVNSKFCSFHFYDANPQNYGDIGELLEPIYKWLKIHYPNDVKLLIDTNSCELLTNHRTYFSNEICNTNLAKAMETLIRKENSND